MKENMILRAALIILTMGAYLVEVAKNKIGKNLELKTLEAL
jgi:hypothetical protein